MIVWVPSERLWREAEAYAFAIGFAFFDRMEVPAGDVGDLRDDVESGPVSKRHIAALRRQFLRDPSRIPPVVLDASLSLYDGRHRLAAARSLGVRMIPAVVVSQEG